MKDYLEEKVIDKELKIKHWGKGEWVDEADRVTFEYKGHSCKVLRIHAWDGNKGDHLFGGHLCGYVKTNSDISIDDEDNLDVHGGITFVSNGWIGFDCAHSMDYVPSMEIFFNKNNDLQQLYKKMEIEDCEFFKKSYKNIGFCVEECKALVDQLENVGVVNE